MKSFRNVNLGLGFAASNIARRKNGYERGPTSKKESKQGILGLGFAGWNISHTENVNLHHLCL